MPMTRSTRVLAPVVLVLLLFAGTALARCEWSPSPRRADAQLAVSSGLPLHLVGWQHATTTTTTAPPPPTTSPPAPPPAPTPRPSGHAVSRPQGSRQACILARENGGSYGRSSNPSHFGAYQFDRQTWAANSGDPSHWGSASPAEQDAVFNNTIAAHGYSAWAPYDGC